VKVVDLTGRVVGRLVILARAGSTPHGKAAWHCRCACGTEKIIASNSLTNGTTQSCGCRQKELTSKRFFKHGHSARKTKTYRAWKHMLERCFNPNDKAYKWYGGDGITVDPRWLKFENFLTDMGEAPPGLTLDRINNDDDYMPGNCRWTTYSVQAYNRRPIAAKYKAARLARLREGHANYI